MFIYVDMYIYIYIYIFIYTYIYEIGFDSGNGLKGELLDHSCSGSPPLTTLFHPADPPTHAATMGAQNM